MKKLFCVGILVVSIMLNIILCCHIFANPNLGPIKPLTPIFQFTLNSSLLPEFEVEALNNNLYYGSWEITDKVFIEEEPVRGLIYSEEEIQEEEKRILEKEAENLEFTKFSVTYDQELSRQIIGCQYMLFPAQDSYQLHFHLTLKDIGILQENADYFAYIQMKDEEKQELKLIIKDRNTLILCRDTYFIEYKRVSEDDLDFILFSG